jgi:aspartate carbamoyltransferase catalytic subunit
VNRLTPAYGKDWNERLVHNGHPEQANQPERDKPMTRVSFRDVTRTLWQWYSAAQRLGRSAGYLSRITEVAREFTKGEPLSDKAKAVMQRDLQETRQSRLGQIPPKPRLGENMSRKPQFTNSEVEVGT